MFESVKSRKSAIGNEFLKRGILTELQIEKVLNYQKEHKELKFGEIVDILDMCDKRELLDVIAYKIEFTPVMLDDNILINPVKYLPRDVIINYKVIPFDLEGSTLKVAFSDPQDTKKVKEIELLLINQGYTMDIYVTLYTSIMKQIEGIKTLETKFIDSDEKDVSKLVDNVIVTALEKRASDIHVEPMEDKIRIRFRIDGELVTITELSKIKQGMITDRIKYISNMSQDSKLEQYGNINTYKGYSIHVSSQKNINGEKFLLKIKCKNVESKMLSELGFFNDENLINKILKNKRGIVLVCSPVDQGKTTTFYSMIEYLNKPEINITSIESPVERKIYGLNQVEISVNSDFGNVLKATIRQDPDVICIGDVTDRDIIKLMESINSLHLVLGTMCSSDVLEVITKFRGIGVPDYNISAILTAIVSQRLVRKLCNNCKKSHLLKDEEIKYIDKISKLTGVKFDLKSQKIYEPVGCPLCNNTGYFDRTALFEVLLLDEYLKDMISSGKSIIDIQKYAIQNTQYKPLIVDGMNKVLNGITTIDELKKIFND